MSMYSFSMNPLILREKLVLIRRLYLSTTFKSDTHHFSRPSNNAHYSLHQTSWAGETFHCVGGASRRPHTTNIHSPRHSQTIHLNPHPSLIQDILMLGRGSSNTCHHRQQFSRFARQIHSNPLRGALLHSPSEKKGKRDWVGARRCLWVGLWRVHQKE